MSLFLKNHLLVIIIERKKMVILSKNWKTMMIIYALFNGKVFAP